MRIIGLLGNSGAGKDTICQMIQNATGATRIGLADPMKEMFQVLYGWSDEQLWGESSSRNGIDAALDTSPRYVLRDLGIRAREWYPNTWIDCALRKASLVAGNVVFNDLRFLNDCQGVRAAGGEVWYIVRPGVEPVLDDIIACSTHIIVNAGSLSQLRTHVQGLLCK